MSFWIETFALQTLPGLLMTDPSICVGPVGRTADISVNLSMYCKYTYSFIYLSWAALDLIVLQDFG